jgi:hypothetical protein
MIWLGINKGRELTTALKQKQPKILRVTVNKTETFVFYAECFALDLVSSISKKHKMSRNSISKRAYWQI